MMGCTGSTLYCLSMYLAHAVGLRAAVGGEPDGGVGVGRQRTVRASQRAVQAVQGTTCQCTVLMQWGSGQQLAESTTGLGGRSAGKNSNKGCTCRTMYCPSMYRAHGVRLWAAVGGEPDGSERVAGRWGGAGVHAVADSGRRATPQGDRVLPHRSVPAGLPGPRLGHPASRLHPAPPGPGLPPLPAPGRRVRSSTSFGALKTAPTCFVSRFS